MAPSRAQTLSSLVQYLSYISPDIHLACLLATAAHLSAKTSVDAAASSTAETAQTHALELVFFALDDQTQRDVRSRFTLASAELEPFELIARTLGFPSNDRTGFKKMLLSKGEKMALPSSDASQPTSSGPASADPSRYATVIVHALYPPPPTSPTSPPPTTQEQFSIFRVLNFELPPPTPTAVSADRPSSSSSSSSLTQPWLTKLHDQASVLEDWRHVLARGIKEPWDTVLQAQAQTSGRDVSTLPNDKHPGLVVVSEMAILRGLERCVPLLEFAF